MELEWTKGKLFIGYKNRYTFLFVDADDPVETDMEEFQKGSPCISIMGDQLLLRVGRQGIFCTFSGKKTGKKLDWSSQPIGIAYRKPYAISLQDEQIEIHNCADEQMVQLVKNTQGLQKLGDGALLLGASPSIVFCVHSRSWESQMVQLIKAQRVDEAINLFKMSVPASTPQSEKDRIMMDINKAAGVVLFSNLKFNLAIPFLKESDIDVREVISLFPGYLPVSSRYKPRHQLESLEYLIIETLTKRTRTHSAPEDRVRQYEHGALECVLEFLLYRREQEGVCQARPGSEKAETRKCLDTACIKLYVDLGLTDGLTEFLNSPGLMADERDIVKYLTEYEKFHALAVFYRIKGEYVKALDLWKDLGASGDDVEIDAALRDTIDLLSTSNDLRMIFKYSKWVFEMDPEAASEIFSSKKRKENLPVEEVLKFLTSINAGDYACMKYLEHVVYETKNVDERHHTKLANLYLDFLLPVVPEGYEGKRPEAGTEPGELGEFRSLLIRFLEHSNHYNPSLVLQRIQDTVLYEEQVLCFTKLGRHEEALNILFTNVRSYSKATSHCAKFNEESDVNLFVVLLKVYLQLTKDGAMPKVVLKLLNDFPQYLRPDEVIPLLPSTVKIEQLEKYLNQSLRHNMTKLCSGQIEKNLRQTDLIHQQLSHSKVTGKYQVIDSTSRCAVCKGTIGDAMFVWYPNNVLCHFKCKKFDTICPVTGRDFKKSPVNLLEKTNEKNTKKKTYY